MRLQSKLTLAFAVALLPIAALAAVARLLVAEQYRGQFRRELDEAQAEAERAYDRLSRDVVVATKRIARIEDPTIGRLLVEIGKGAVDDERSRELARHVEQQMRPLGFDVLAIIDERGQLLAAGHFPGRFGDIDPGARERGRRARAGCRISSRSGWCSTARCRPSWRSRWPSGSRRASPTGRRWR